MELNNMKIVDVYKKFFFINKLNIKIKNKCG